MIDRVFLGARGRLEPLVEPLFKAWVVACVLLGVAVIVVRVVGGPIHGYWKDALVLTWGAPLWVMLLGFVGGWVWFAFWLLARPFPRLRESRFMHPDRW